MSLVNNLNAIKDCKDNIKTALINKGVDMTDVKFSEYAEKINSLQLESGDTPTPSPSVDYIYSNGYVEGGDETKDIISFEPYEITLDSEGKFVIELICPEEIPSYEGGTYYDIIFTVEIPKGYIIENFEFYDEGGDGKYVNQDYKSNPRHNTVIRNGLEYTSYVRSTTDGLDIGSVDVQSLPLKYRITITKE